MLLLAGAASCSGAGREPVVLELLQARPEPGATGVFLNEELELYFSEEIDLASVHAQSARIATQAGDPARGHWQVAGRRLRFTPEPVLASDLSDGGYRPGRTYLVELSGFPRPDGLRGVSGAPLARSIRWEFRVVDVTAPERGFLFEDASLETGLPLVLRSLEVPPGGPIVLEGREPLDPSTLFGEDFELSPIGSPGARIPVRARLAQNFDRRAPRPRGTTLVELIPQRTLDSGAEYVLRIPPSTSRLRDFGGHRVPYLGGFGGQRPVIVVRASSAPSTNVHFEPFMGTENRSPEAVPGLDGTAWWGDSGRVELRLPRAAGSAEQGTVELSGSVDASDLQALRMLLPAGAEAALSERPGLVILRAQGSLRIEGRLRRRVPSAGANSLRGGETLSGWLDRVQAPGSPATEWVDLESLSAWLDRAQALGVTTTVLVAGGDLILSGEVDVAGPLLLAAGGRLRLQRDPGGIRASQVHLLGREGLGPSFLDPLTGLDKKMVDAGLELDLVVDNPLVAPLTFGVRSGPIPREGQAARWLGPPHVGGRHGTGAFRVRYVGSIRSRDGSESTQRVVDDPSLLTDCPSLRLQVELSVGPGVPWDPPWVDFAEVSWDPLGTERPR